MVEISSKSNENIKYIHKLMSSSKMRKKEGVFLIEGIRLCEEALKNFAVITKIFYTSKCYEKFKGLIEEIIKKNKPQVYEVNESVMHFLSDTEAPQGIMCVCKIIDKKVNIDKIKLYSKIVLLENIQNPSNIGSIFRSLNAFGLDLVVISSNSCDIYNPKVLRGSMGAIFSLNIVIIDNLPNFLNLLKGQGFKVYASLPGAKAKSVTVLGETRKAAVVLGNEGNGVSAEVRELCDENITIPMCSCCESLNVSVAAGIISWEMAGRRIE